MQMSIPGLASKNTLCSEPFRSPCQPKSPGLIRSCDQVYGGGLFAITCGIPEMLDSLCSIISPVLTQLSRQQPTTVFGAEPDIPIVYSNRSSMHPVRRRYSCHSFKIGSRSNGFRRAVPISCALDDYSRGRHIRDVRLPLLFHILSMTQESFHQIRKFRDNGRDEENMHETWKIGEREGQSNVCTSANG